MGTSGAAASAERSTDSLEREDDSLFPACLLELFLSHISLVKSPPVLLPAPLPHSHWLMTYPPPLSALGSDQHPTHLQKAVKYPCRQNVFRLFQCLSLCWRPSWKRSIHLNCAIKHSMEGSAAPVNTHTDQLDPCLVCINIYSVHKALFAVPSHVNHTHIHTCTHTVAIYWSKQGHNHQGEGHKTLAGIFIQPRDEVLWKTRPK